MNGKLLTAMCVVWCAAAVLAAPAPATGGISVPNCPPGTTEMRGLCVMQPPYKDYGVPPEPISDTPKRVRAKRMVGMIPHGYLCPGGSIRLHNGECVRMATPPPEYRDYFNLY